MKHILLCAAFALALPASAHAQDIAVTVPPPPAGLVIDSPRPFDQFDYAAREEALRAREEVLAKREKAERKARRRAMIGNFLGNFGNNMVAYGNRPAPPPVYVPPPAPVYIWPPEPKPLIKF